MFAGKKSAQIREILISESAWEEMTCLFAPSLGNWIDGKDAMSGALINGAGSAAGYGIGKAISKGANASVNWWKGGWDPKFNPELQKYTEIKGGMGLSKEIKASNVPSSIGDIGGSITSEVGGKYTEYKMNQERGGK